jgi:hypothetical protein
LKPSRRTSSRSPAGWTIFGLRLRALRLNGWRRTAGNLQPGADNALDGAQRVLLRAIAKRYGNAARARTCCAANAHVDFHSARERNAGADTIAARVTERYLDFTPVHRALAETFNAPSDAA